MFLLHVQTIKSSIPFLFQYIFESYFVILVEIGLDRKLPFHSPKSALFLRGHTQTMWTAMGRAL